MKQVKVSLKIVGKWYEAKGKDYVSAVLKLKPEVAKGVGVLVMESGDLKRERVLGAPLITSLFTPVSRMRKEIAVKQLKGMFEGL